MWALLLETAVGRGAMSSYAHFGYMASGIDDEVTLRANREGFLKFQLLPRFGRNLETIARFQRAGRLTLYGEFESTFQT